MTMNIDQLIEALEAARMAYGSGGIPVKVITKSGAVKALSGKIVYDNLVGALAIKTVN